MLLDSIHIQYALVFWETRRSDFGVSMGHHVATFILVMLSYIARFSRGGSIVLVMMPVMCSLRLGRCLNIVVLKGFLALPLFSLLYLGSYFALPTIRFGFFGVLAMSLIGPIYYYIFNTLLYCLLVLHIYWWILMYRMLVKQVKARGQVSEDVRSDSEDEHED